MGLYIPSAEVFNFPHYDVGDNREAQEQLDPEQTRVDNEGPLGPLIELPSHHDVGSGPDSDAVKQFGDLGRPISGPYYEYTPGHGEQLGDVDDPTTIDPWPPFGEEQTAVTGYV